MVQVTVTVDEAHRAAVGDVAEALRAAGMQVDAVQEATVTGAVEDAAEGALRSVAGVASVDRALGFRLPPPDSPVQ